MITPKMSVPKNNCSSLCITITFCTLLSCIQCLTEKSETADTKFPSDFLFGVSSSAYQIEGGQNRKGAGSTIWDHSRKHNPEYFHDSGKNDTIFCDSLNKWKEDVQCLRHLGVNFYRFSISWSRILPDGLSHNINKEGVRYYNDLIDELVAKGIRPMVTMYHYDLPLAFQNIGGWTNPYMTYYFENYARILFHLYGDRVKHWITMNGACPGYGDLDASPFLTEPGVIKYLCSHVMVLAHAKVYHLYDNEFRTTQQGVVGFTVDGKWFEPKTNSKRDIEAAERAREFVVGLLVNPIFHPEGNYPSKLVDRIEQISIKEGHVSSKLPPFSQEEIVYIQGTYDFLGLNVYTTFLVEDYNDTSLTTPSFNRDLGVRLTQSKDWGNSHSKWLKVYPEGLRKMLKWVKTTYDDFPIIITENGFSDDGEINDINRIKYYKGYLTSLLQSIHEDEIQVKAYAAWSLLDNFEWRSGFSEKFGLYHVDFNDPNRKRTPKLSVEWYKKVILEKRVIKVPGSDEN